MTDRETGYLTAEEMQALRQVSTASLTTQLLKRGLQNTFMQGVLPLRPDLRMVGYAFTLRYIPAREDLDRSTDYDNWTNPQRVAVESVGPDDVLVIDARGDLSAASLGHILMTRIMKRGAAGVVSDGAFRDSPSISGLNMPTYSSGMHGTTSFVAHHPMDMNLPIGCGGVAVFPGDVIVGDTEGVVVIPRHLAGEVARDTLEQDRFENWALARVQSGASIRGVYPPDEETRAEYEEWRASQG
jgi:regulator of RNase E activity RraA